MKHLLRIILMALTILLADTVSSQTLKLDEILDNLKQSHPRFEREKLSALVAGRKEILIAACRFVGWD